MVMRSVTSVTPFYGGYGYAVSHSEPSALIPLIGYIYFSHIRLWAWLWHMVYWEIMVLYGYITLVLHI